MGLDFYASVALIRKVEELSPLALVLLLNHILQDFLNEANYGEVVREIAASRFALLQWTQERLDEVLDEAAPELPDV